MSDTFQVKGRFHFKPPPTNTDLSGDFEIAADILESLSISKRLATTIVLDADAIEAVNMADITEAGVLILKATEPVTVTLTTTAGAAQVIGGVKFMILMNTDDPVTALSLTRAAGTSTSCRLVLAEV